MTNVYVYILFLGCISKKNWYKCFRIKGRNERIDAYNEIHKNSKEVWSVSNSYVQIDRFSRKITVVECIHICIRVNMYISEEGNTSKNKKTSKFIHGLSSWTISKRKLIDDDDNIRLHSWDVIGNFKYSVSVLFGLNSKW